MRNRQDNNQNDYNRNRDPRWLSDRHQGQNSDRGNYRIDSNFNRGYGDNADSHYLDDRSFNSHADHQHMHPQGRFQSGGAYYAGPDYTQGRESEDNPYGMSYVPSDSDISYNHYDPRADYSNIDRDERDQMPEPWGHMGLADERFGHDVRRGGDDRNMGRYSRGDYESYRRYEHGNNMYDNDYRGGFADRNYNQDQAHYGEDSRYSNMERWNGRSDQRHDRYDQDRGDRR
ncbi:hypothetical protein [Pontibacter harenae]|uniref:hypothetical protein n=1 Tax=Pontibacter harenae TaxID=2894083 RepID=UPI001E5FCEB3|nr:hypothetical protein [Pontibacter harenae]MCC9167499.1 hypothetical protein [Pontibacter harenae]